MRYGAAPRLRRDLLTLGIVSVAYLAVSTFVTNSYYQLIMTLVPIWAVFGVSWNILSGYGGQLSFGHASFFGIGAYTVTLALVYWNLTPWLGIPLGMIVAGIAAVLIGLPTFRLRGHYFALSMLAYPLAILYFLQYLGFQEMSLPMHRDHPAAFLEFTDPRLYTVVSVGLLIAGVFVCMLVENSRFGLALLAIRQNELAAEAAGINARLWKMRALVVSGMIAAAAGGLLCLRAAGGHAGFRVRHAGLRAGRGGDAVRRRRLGLGTGDRRRHPGSAGRIAECRTGEYPAGHSGRGVWRGDHRHHAGLTRRPVLDDPRPFLPPEGRAPAAGIPRRRRADAARPGRRRVRCC